MILRKELIMPRITEGTMPFLGYRTWYRITEGKNAGAKPPLLRRPARGLLPGTDGMDERTRLKTQGSRFLMRNRLPFFILLLFPG